MAMRCKVLRRVILESPYAGDVVRNIDYLRRALHHSIGLGESPFASHAIYTQPGVLDDDDPAQRELGILAGEAWRLVALACVVYTDFGISGGMEAGIASSVRLKLPIEYRTIGKIGGGR